MEGWRKQLLSPKLSHSTIGRAGGRRGNSILPTLKPNRLTEGRADIPTDRPMRRRGPSATATTPARERYAATEEKTNHSRSEGASEASHDECEKLSLDTDREGEGRERRFRKAQHADLKARFPLVRKKPLTNMKAEQYIPDRHASLCMFWLWMYGWHGVGGGPKQMDHCHHGQLPLSPLGRTQKQEASPATSSVRLGRPLNGSESALTPHVGHVPPID